MKDIDSVEQQSKVQQHRNRDGVEIGYAMIVTSFFSMDIVTIVLGSIVTLGCCCASEYQLSKKSKRWATITVVIAVAKFITLGIYVGLFFSTFSEVFDKIEEMDENSNFDDGISPDISGQFTTIFSVGIINVILTIMSVVFACLYTFDRG
mmetsp:Transcript_35370/g.39129  ORF Transcript_35370/g.39129 Transcript_35370/m.39129 type:complete len:150 (+) Transcript_35370:80-529(+)